MKNQGRISELRKKDSFANSSQRSHGIPQRQHLRLLLQDIPDVLLHEPGIDDDLVTELVHPGVAHDEEALLARAVAPAVHDAPAHGLAVLADLHGRQDHGVGHLALAGHQALRLGLVEAEVEGEGVVVEGGVHDAGGAVAGFADVGAEEDGDAGFEHVDCGGFDGLAFLASGVGERV